MKKFIAIALATLSISFAAISAEAKTPASSAHAAPQYGGQWDRNHGRRNNRRVWTTTEVRVVRTRRGLFRNTYLVSHFRNGRTQTQLIRSVRIYR